MKRVKCRTVTTIKYPCEHYELGSCRGAMFCPPTACKGDKQNCDQYKDINKKYQILNKLDEAIEFAKANEWELPLTIIVTMEDAREWILNRKV